LIGYSSGDNVETLVSKSYLTSSWCF
jgi:hypothetical protein